MEGHTRFQTARRIYSSEVSEEARNKMVQDLRNRDQRITKGKIFKQWLCRRPRA